MDYDRNKHLHHRAEQARRQLMQHRARRVEHARREAQPPLVGPRNDGSDQGGAIAGLAVVMGSIAFGAVAAYALMGWALS